MFAVLPRPKSSTLCPNLCSVNQIKVMEQWSWVEKLDRENVSDADLSVLFNSSGAACLKPYGTMTPFSSRVSKLKPKHRSNSVLGLEGVDGTMAKLRWEDTVRLEAAKCKVWDLGMKKEPLLNKVSQQLTVTYIFQPICCSLTLSDRALELVPTKVGGMIWFVLSKQEHSIGQAPLRQGALDAFVLVWK